jgi:hypothetical protein
MFIARAIAAGIDVDPLTAPVTGYVAAGDTVVHWSWDCAPLFASVTPVRSHTVMPARVAAGVNWCPLCAGPATSVGEQRPFWVPPTSQMLLLLWEVYLPRFERLQEPPTWQSLTRIVQDVQAATSAFPPPEPLLAPARRAVAELGAQFRVAAAPFAGRASTWDVAAVEGFAARLAHPSLFEAPPRPRRRRFVKAQFPPAAAVRAAYAHLVDRGFGLDCADELTRRLIGAGCTVEHAVEVASATVRQVTEQIDRTPTVLFVENVEAAAVWDRSAMSQQELLWAAVLVSSPPTCVVGRWQAHLLPAVTAAQVRAVDPLMIRTVPVPDAAAVDMGQAVTAALELFVEQVSYDVGVDGVDAVATACLLSPACQLQSVASCRPAS